MSNPLDQLLLNVDAPSRMNLRNPANKELMRDKEGKPAYIDVISSEADAVRKFWREQNTKYPNPDATQREKNLYEYFAVITVGWYLVGRDGNPIDYPFNPKNARDLYSNAGAIDIIEQLREHASDRSNFIGAASGN